MQVGSEAGQTLDVRLSAASVRALGLSDVDVGTSSFSAQRSILHLDEALEFLNGQRATIGAQLSRFDSTISNLQVSVENASQSRSRVLDADYASETASLVRANVLRQAGVAVAAQANADPQRVLSLLSAL
jgi:flagellin